MPAPTKPHREKPRFSPSAFGKSLQKLRTFKQYNILRTFGALVGCSGEHIAHIESGQTQYPGTELAFALARVLGATIESGPDGLYLELRPPARGRKVAT